MKITKELEQLVIKWQPKLKLQDWDLDIQLKSDKEYKEIEEAVGFGAGYSKGMNTSTEERQHSLIYLNHDSGSDTLETYLVHELIHSITNEYNEFSQTLIELVDSEESKSILRTRYNEIIEKLVWKLTRIILELDKK